MKVNQIAAVYVINKILCHHLFGREDVVVLCASGTAVIVDLSYMLDLEAVGTFGPPFIPFSANAASIHGIGTQPSSGKRYQEPAFVEKPLNDGHEVSFI